MSCGRDRYPLHFAILPSNLFKCLLKNQYAREEDLIYVFLQNWLATGVCVCLFCLFSLFQMNPRCSCATVIYGFPPMCVCFVGCVVVNMLYIVRSETRLHAITCTLDNFIYFCLDTHNSMDKWKYSWDFLKSYGSQSFF